MAEMKRPETARYQALKRVPAHAGSFFALKVNLCAHVRLDYLSNTTLSLLFFFTMTG
ncbi:hypothetical protein [Marispirochaeta sp.]|uniref:hypothetical protein n=1 Tax=Marispirochaeta sp. TaxID=2038653 RepID=UPI0029C85DB7|nr:hypothetical protein [Marispirochaeta sp.]